MGVNIKELTVTHPVQVKDLSGKILAVDSYNLLYQFITTIRGPDGTPLQDSNGHITSHLQGLFSRTSNLLSAGVKLVFVFDGEPPALKRAELDRRREIKDEAKAAFDEASAAGDIESMRKYAGRFSYLTKDMAREAQELALALGQPVVLAPSEGEAQMASLVRAGSAWAGVSQDYDSLLYQAPRLVRNLSIQGRRKLPGKAGWKFVEPELLEFKENLDSIGITPDGLLCLAILVGTDYNPGGIKGIGPKKALDLVRKSNNDPHIVFEGLDFDSKSPVPWKEIWNTFKHMPVQEKPPLKWTGLDPEEVRRILIEEHQFSAERVNATLETLSKHLSNKAQKSLGDF